MSLATMYSIGSIVRYGNGLTALMKIESCNVDHGGPGEHIYHGQQFYGGGQGAYHSDIEEATPAETHLWEQNQKKESLLAASRVALQAIGDALNNLPAKGECAKYLKAATVEIQRAINEAVS